LIEKGRLAAGAVIVYISRMRRFALIALLALTPTLLPAQNTWTDARKQEMANRVRQEFLHAWNGYKTYAWGHDELRPISRTPKDWYGPSLLMTPVDALDTMTLMGLNDEAATTRDYIAEHLNFNRDIYVKNFEITIRLLGGLLSNYQLSGDKRLLVLAQDLGNRLLPAFNSPTGMPYVFVNLKTGATKGAVSNPAEVGTLLLEFGTLSKLTGNPVYYDKTKRAVVAVYDRRSPIGLVGTSINVETGQWVDTASHISGMIDSYYEYLLKASILFDDQDCARMWKESIAAVNRYVADDVRGELWYGQVDMNTGKRVSTHYGALDAFFPAVLALSGDLDRAKRLQDSSYKMWSVAGVEPEEIDYTTMKITDPAYPLRPEIIESTYYLYFFTGDSKYLDMGQTYFDALQKYCRTGDAYASLKNVETKEKANSMESFFFAETLKYFYLLYAPRSTFDLKTSVFNTEAHPLKLTVKASLSREISSFGSVP
jgi:mannosidase alpha-like ER degradation enhancer 2